MMIRATTIELNLFRHFFLFQGGRDYWYRVVYSKVLLLPTLFGAQMVDDRWRCSTPDRDGDVDLMSVILPIVIFGSFVSLY